MKIHILGENWGKAVVVAEPGGTARAYLHVTPSVADGAHVEPGTKVGTVLRDHARRRLRVADAATTLVAMEVDRKDPVIEAYKAGIDRTLLVENLRRGVEERFCNLMALQRFALELRRAGKEAIARRDSR